MSTEAPHIPVLLDEVLASLQPDRSSFIVDLTLGAGGHSEALLDASAEGARLLAIDRDRTALALAGKRLEKFGDRVTLAKSNYRDFASVLDDEEFGVLEDGVRKVDAILLDAGVSSMQLDDAERGFSWRNDAPLDMRMSPDDPLTAAAWLDEIDESTLRWALRDYGEVKRAGHFARAIMEARRAGNLETTGQLADLCEAKAGRAEAKKSVHPATLVFQGIRIAVNDELAGLQEAVDAIPGRLTRGGCAAVISFHSLEDRIVKRSFRDATRTDVPRGVPIRGDDVTDFRLVDGLQRPTDAEISRNPRARSARLRVIQRRAVNHG